MKYLRQLVIYAQLCGCAAAAPIQPAPVAPSSAPEAQAAPLSLNICYANEALLGMRTVGLRRIVESAVEALVAFDSKPARIGVGRCEDDSFRGCVGHPGVIACRADDLAQLAAAASIGAQLMAQVPSMRERFATTGALGASDVLAALARAEVDGAEDETRLSLVLAIARELDVSPKLIAAAGVDGTNFLHDYSAPQPQVAEDAWKLMLDFIVAHELFHARGAVCAEARPAASEEDALFNFATDKFLCQNSPDTEELLADRCAIRALRYSERAKLDGTQESQWKTALASELLAWALISAHHQELLLDPQRDFTRLTPGQLHPVLRVLLTTNELKLRGHSGAPAHLCDRVARDVVMMLQKEAQSCGSQGPNLDERILQRLPRGAEQAFAGQTAWNDATFWCGDGQTG